MKAGFKKGFGWITAKPWLLFSLIGMLWALIIIGVVGLKNKMARGEWYLADFLSIPGNIIANFEAQSIDWRFTWRGLQPGTPEVVILQIGESSFTGTHCSEEDYQREPDLKLLELWPYPRKAWAKIIDKLCASGAKVIGIDVLFAHPSTLGVEDDIICRDTIQAHQNRLVLAATYRPQAEAQESSLLLPNETLVGSLQDFRNLIGVANYDYSAGGTIRATASEIPDVDLLSFPTLVAEKAGLVIPEQPMKFIINFAGGSEAFKVIDLYKLFYSKTWENELQHGQVFKDKIVLIGASASILQDYHNTSIGVMPGVIVHANTVSNFIDRPKLTDRDSLWFVIGAGIIQGLALGCFSRPFSKVVPAILVLLAIGYGASWLFVHEFVVVPLFMPWLAAGLTSFTVITWQGTTEFLSQQRTRKTLETYVSPNVAEYVLQNQNAYQAAQAGLRKPCTILFSDIRGFTTMTENSKDESQLVDQLNEYLTEMVHCVFAHGGTLHKFIGDAVMAVWGDTHSLGEKSDALAAVRTTLAMRAELAKLNEKWTGEGRPTLRIGIGLNHGVVVVGAIGSKEAPLRLEFTVIGNAVNTASRVETETKNQGVDILISRSVQELVSDTVDCESRGEISLKGKTEKVELFHLRGLKDGGSR